MLVPLCFSLLAAACASSSTPTTKGVPERLIRFVDETGAIRFGQPCSDDEQHADVITGAEALFNAEAKTEKTIGLSFTGERLRVKELLSPVPKPPAIYGIGLNYIAHAHEANLTIPHHPAVFFKNINSFNGPNKKISIPWQSTLPDYEGELGVIVGPRPCKDEDSSDPSSIFGPGGCVLGFTAVNDVSARCWQSDTSDDEECKNNNGSYHPTPIGQWSFSKSFDTHCPVGPSLLLANPSAVWGKSSSGQAAYIDGSKLQLQTYLNGNLMQNTSTDDLIFNVGKIIEAISMATTIDVGTVIATGTPSGIGYARDPKVLLQQGDNITVSIQPHIGSLTNFIEQTKRPASPANKAASVLV